MENMDSTVIATSLPPADIGTSPLTLKLAITSYLLSLASSFQPAAGPPTASRARCSVQPSRLHARLDRLRAIEFRQHSSSRVFFRPRRRDDDPVGRLVILRTIDKSALVNAMAWVTVPALIGPVMGPPLGGSSPPHFRGTDFLITFPSACRHLDGDEIHRPDPRGRRAFDIVGLVLADLALRHRVRIVGRGTRIAALADRGG